MLYYKPCEPHKRVRYDAGGSSEGWCVFPLGWHKDVQVADASVDQKPDKSPGAMVGSIMWVVRRAFGFSFLQPSTSRQHALLKCCFELSSTQERNQQGLVRTTGQWSVEEIYRTKSLRKQECHRLRQNDIICFLQSSLWGVAWIQLRGSTRRTWDTPFIFCRLIDQ